MMKLRFAERVWVKGSKRRALKKFLAALSELTEWLIRGEEHQWRLVH